ncbi:hypothetical protein [Bacteroides congonensis]|uniref:hypothetical protein n=1 Tax=Bacteroides congonensis TaxID=1871006 RepID=UPI001E5F0935|nr:hypothetical protein [Bacteroides congonensis]
MIISPFTPLFFSPSTDKFGAKSKYVQLFARTDRIFIELISSPEEQEPVVYINNLLNDASTPIILSSWQMNDDKIIYFYNISLLSCGYYNVVVNGKTSEIFKITDDEHELSETTLIQYSMKDNKQRLDAVWWIDGMQYFFDFRVPGGFKDNGWTFGVDNEQFVTSDEDIVELFSHEYTTVLFTLGNGMGCPVWFAELLNRILCCNYVYFDEVRYARKESNVPELNQQIEGLKSFVFNQMLQKVRTMNPVLEWNNQVSMRRIQNDIYRITSDSGELRSIKSGSEVIEKYESAITGKIYMRYQIIATSLFTSYNYYARVILDKPANGNVTFDVPFVETVDGNIVHTVGKMSVINGNYSDERNFSSRKNSYQVDLRAGEILNFVTSENDRTFYEVTWDGEFLEDLPVAPGETPDPPSN